MNTLPHPRQAAHTEQQPGCVRCAHRHRPELPCWKGKHARQVTAELLGTVGRTCWICRAEATTADHITPRSQGGTDDLENLRPACLPCNRRRGTTPNPFTAEDPTPPAGVPLSPRWR